MKPLDPSATGTFHCTIASLITAVEFPEYTVKWDFQCGGRQRLQLFCRKEKSNRTKFCHVDAVILDKNYAKMIIEIEESGGSNIRPIALAGKFFASAMSSHFIDGSGCYPFADSVAFVQIVRTRLDSKIDQLRNLQQSIRCVLPIKNSRLASYQVFYGNESDFMNAGGKELIAHVRDTLTE
jgi:hypothetical protein